MDERIILALEDEEFFRQRLMVTEIDYGNAVESLLTLAVGDTSGSRAAAQVLLSTYNGYNYHMDLTDLCVLDLKFIEQALIVIRGRVLLSKEPHTMVDNGKARFSQLEADWSGLHKARRYASDYE